MSEFRALSFAEQVAAHLRTQMVCGKLRGPMPGVLKLEVDLGVNRKTVDAALRLLEAEGLLLPQGAGRRRLIRPPTAIKTPALRVGILLSEAADLKVDYVVALRHELIEAGQDAVFAPKTATELGSDSERIARMVEKTAVDAWVVVAGSREMLEWFAGQAAPAFALFGRRRGVSIAGSGPNKPPALAAATRALINLGHRRIVLLTRLARREPKPGASEQAFLNELAVNGITPGPYHLPDWEEDIPGFYARLDSLFQVTPPTALIIDEAPFFVATMQFLARRGLHVPEDVSLICTDADPAFRWCQPSVAHIDWDSRPVVRRTLRWAANVGRGKPDLRQTLVPAEFISGGTIGPVAPH